MVTRLFFCDNKTIRRAKKCINIGTQIPRRQKWEETYIQLALYGLMLSDMPSANAVWGAYLKDKGFNRYIIPDEYMTCTVSEFAHNHPEWAYILALSGHVIAVIDGNYYDTWDSGAMTPIYYWREGGK